MSNRDSHRANISASSSDKPGLASAIASNRKNGQLTRPPTGLATPLPGHLAPLELHRRGFFFGGSHQHKLLQICRRFSFACIRGLVRRLVLRLRTAGGEQFRLHGYHWCGIGRFVSFQTASPGHLIVHRCML